MVSDDALLAIVRAPDGGPPLGPTWRRTRHTCGALVSVQMRNRTTVAQVEPALCGCGAHLWTYSVADGSLTTPPRLSGRVVVRESVSRVDP